MAATEKMADTGWLAASIAHEINNPPEAVTNLKIQSQFRHYTPPAKFWNRSAPSKTRPSPSPQTITFYASQTLRTSAVAAKQKVSL
jgi:hypothetical protein